MEEINIFPRMSYCHYVKIPQASRVIQWNFSTKKHTIAFGLFFRTLDLENGDSTCDISRNLQSEYITASSVNGDRTRPRLNTESQTPLGIINSDKALSTLQSRLGLSKLKASTSTKSKRTNESASLSPEREVSPTDKKEASTTPKKSPKIFSLKDWQTLIPIQMYHSSKATIKNQWIAEEEGIYLLYFSNGFSVRNSKILTLFVTTINNESNPITNPYITISGWLMKKKRKRIQGWAKRWVWIQNKTIMYSSTEGGIIRGKAALSDSIVSVESSKHLIIIDSNIGPLLFRAPNSHSFAKWSAVLKELIESSDNSSTHSTHNQDSENINTKSTGLPARTHLEFLKSVSAIKDIIGNIATSDLPSSLKVTPQNGEFISPQTDGLSCKTSDKLSEPASSDTQRGSIRNLLSKVKIKSDSSHKSNDQLQKSDSLSFKLVEILQHLEHLANYENSIYSFLECRNRGISSEPENGFDEIRADKQIHLIGINHPRDSMSDIFYDTREVLHSEDDKASITKANDSINAFSSSDDDECFEVYNEEIMDYESESGTHSPDLLSIQASANIQTNYSSGISVQSSAALVFQAETSLSQIAEGDEPGFVKNSDADYPPAASFSVVSELGNINRRISLPSNEPKDSVNIISILRKNIGKDLSQVRMPIQMNEPLSATQTLCEELRCSHLLNKAALLPDSLDRLMYVVGFAISSYAPRKYRVSYKPFNPMLGETYELVRPDLGFRFISEKVSHNPMIVACHAESPHFLFWQDSNIKSRFWGRSMELTQSSLIHVEMPTHRDHFTYTKAITIVKGILTGNKSIEFNGKIEVKNHTTGDIATLVFKESTMFAGSDDKFEGFITSSDSSIPKRKVYGKWSESLYCETNKGPILIWQAESNGKGAKEKQYGFESFATTLNEITNDLLNTPENRNLRRALTQIGSQSQPTNQDVSTRKYLLPNTDARLRPDMRLYEDGKVSEAEPLKNQLENAQRSRLNKMKNDGQEWVPKWFELAADPKDSSMDVWRYKGGYWKNSLEQSFSDVPFFSTEIE